MSRMNGPKRKRNYEGLVRRDGEVCYIGGEMGSPQTLVIDHLDNNPRNNASHNLHLVCRCINHVKNPRGRSRKQSSVYESGRDNGLDGVRTSSAEMAKNWQSEPDFRHWLFAEVWRKGKLELEEAINCGAAVARCSQETIKRYLKKEISRIRPYQIIEDQETKQKFIVFREDWEKARVKEEQRRILMAQERNWKEGPATGKGLTRILKDLNIPNQCEKEKPGGDDP